MKLLSAAGTTNIGGDKVNCEKCCIPQRQATKKAKRFTVIGLKNLLGETLFCIVIIKGKK